MKRRTKPRCFDSEEPCRLPKAILHGSFIREYGRILSVICFHLLIVSCVPRLIAQAAGRRHVSVEPQEMVENMNGTHATVIKTNTAFMLSLYRQLVSQAKDFIFSPDNLSTAWSMTYGATRSKSVLDSPNGAQFTLSPKRLLPEIIKLLASSPPIDSVNQSRAAESPRVLQSKNFLPAYRRLMEADYSPALHRLDHEPWFGPSRTATFNQLSEAPGRGSLGGLSRPAMLFADFTCQNQCEH